MTRPARLRLGSTLMTALLGLCSLPLQAQQTGGLQQRMSASEFKAAGLDKLSPAELASLNQWLGSHAKVVTKMVSPDGKPVFYDNSKKRSPISAHLVGRFDGWNGHNLVTLDNGQQWQQVGSDQPLCNASTNPVARLKPSLFGNWLMYVDGCNDTVHVKRER